MLFAKVIRTNKIQLKSQEVFPDGQIGYPIFFSNEKTKNKTKPKAPAQENHNNRIGKMSLLVPTSPEVRVVVLS